MLCPFHLGRECPPLKPCVCLYGGKFVRWNLPSDFFFPLSYCKQSPHSSLASFKPQGSIFQPAARMTFLHKTLQWLLLHFLWNPNSSPILQGPTPSWPSALCSLVASDRPLLTTLFELAMWLQCPHLPSLQWCLTALTTVWLTACSLADYLTRWDSAPRTWNSFAIHPSYCVYQWSISLYWWGVLHCVCIHAAVEQLEVFQLFLDLGRYQ